MTRTTAAPDEASQEPPASNRSSAPVPDPGVLTGAMISGIFGIARTQWGASGLPAALSAVVRIVGIVAGVVIVARSARLRRSAPAGFGSMVGSRAYRFVVVLEVVALLAGAAILSAAGESRYVAAWVTAAVGAHFLAFGRFFAVSFYWLGASLLVGGVAGAVVGLSGGGKPGIEATSGLVAAASLLAAGGWRVLGARGGRGPSLRSG